jgi:succinate dehydrogenase / fumarate reductase, iron-sulfur subunit
MTRDERLEGIMGEDGITNCGNAQNCVKVCPMNIPLTKAIYGEPRDRSLRLTRLAQEIRKYGSLRPMFYSH